MEKVGACLLASSFLCIPPFSNSAEIPSGSSQTNFSPFVFEPSKPLWKSILSEKLEKESNRLFSPYLSQVIEFSYNKNPAPFQKRNDFLLNDSFSKQMQQVFVNSGVKFARSYFVEESGLLKSITKDADWLEDSLAGDLSRGLLFDPIEHQGPPGLPQEPSFYEGPLKIRVLTSDPFIALTHTFHNNIFLEAKLSSRSSTLLGYIPIEDTSFGFTLGAKYLYEYKRNELEPKAMGFIGFGGKINKGYLSLGAYLMKPAQSFILSFNQPF